MSEVHTVVLHATGVVLVRSPRYLRYPLLDSIDEMMARGVRDDAAFWDHVLVRFDLEPREIPRLQRGLSEKYRRNLDLWSALPSIRRSHRLILFDTGSPAVWERLRSVNGLDPAFDQVINAAACRLPASPRTTYPALVEHLGLDPSGCLVVDIAPERLAAAEEAGCVTHRYRTPKSLREALVTR